MRQRNNMKMIIAGITHYMGKKVVAVRNDDEDVAVGQKFNVMYKYEYDRALHEDDPVKIISNRTLIDVTVTELYAYGKKLDSISPGLTAGVIFDKELPVIPMGEYWYVTFENPNPS
jgi:hypothetical protein